MIFLDLIDLQKLRKALLYVICVVLALWLQTMVLPRVVILGVRPMFLPVVIVAIGLWEGGVWGGVLGLIAGFWLDLSCSNTRVLFLLLFTAFGFLSGMLAEFFINRRLLSYLLLCVFALLATAFCQIVPLWIFRGAAFGPLLRTALLQSLLAIPLAVPVHYIIRAIAAKQRRQ